MAKYTSNVTLTSAWQAISAGEATVIVEVDSFSGGPVGIAVADALGDLASQTDPQHKLTEFDRPIANFYGLNGKLVFARKMAAATETKVNVTRY